MTDLAILAADTTALEQSGDPATFVVLACERAKDWLTQAVEHGEIDQIVELKSQAEAIRIYTTQKQLGKDAELAAAEIVRRAERGIGVAIRRGQEAGEIKRSEYHGPGGSRHTESRSPSEFLAHNSERTGIYAVTDDVTARTPAPERVESTMDRKATRRSHLRWVPLGKMRVSPRAQRMTGNQRAHCVAAAAVEIINSRKGGKRLPSWWKS